MDYLLLGISLVGIYVIASSAVNLAAGLSGMFSLAYGAIFGLGAYICALLLRQGISELGFLLLVSAVIGALAGGVVCATGLKVPPEHFALTTIAIQLCLVAVFKNWSGLTGGTLGLSVTGKIHFLGYQMSERWHFCLMSVSIATFFTGFCARLIASPFGRLLQVMRASESLTRALGWNPSALKLAVSSLAGGTVCVGGCLFAMNVGFVDPSSFSLTESVFILSVIIVGGIGNSYAPIVGSAMLVGIPEGLRFLGLSGPLAGNIQQTLYGIVLVTVIAIRPGTIQPKSLGT